MEQSRSSALEQTNLDGVLQLSTISALLAAQNFSMPAGYVEQDGVQYMVSVGDSISTREELQQLVAAKIATKTQQEWLELIGGAEFCVTPVCSLEEALDSELTAKEHILQEADSDLGKLQYIGGPVKFSEDASSIRMRAPKLGEHTLDILQELGYNDNEISALHEEGAI